MFRSRQLMFAALLALVVLLSTVAVAAEKDIPDFSMKPRSEVPAQYTWRVEDIYPTYEDWQKDKDALVALVAKIDEKRVGWTESAQKMADLLELGDAIGQKAERLYQYAALQSDVDLGNSKYQIMKGELQSIFVQLGVKLAFQQEDLLKMKDETLAAYFKEEPRLAPFRFGIEQTIRLRAHVLPEDQQKITSMIGLFAGAPAKAANMLNDVDIPAPEVKLADGSTVKLNNAAYYRYRSSKEPSERSAAMRTYWQNRKQYENTFAALFDGEMKQHLFTAKSTNYGDCLEARLDGDGIDTLVYSQLVKSVNDNLDIFQRYLRLKGQLQGLDTMRYEDIYGSAVKSVDKTYTWDEARALVLEALKPLGKEYGTVLRQAFDGRWIDIYSNKGKQMGAYSGGVYGVHPFVKLNFNGQYNEVSTIAHELGHSLHTYYANKTQPHSNAGYPTFLAEIASTFNETLLLRHMLKIEKDDLFKLYLLDSYLDQVRGTIYRQTLFAEFELAMHRRVEAGGTLTADWLDAKYLELTRKYYGHASGVLRVDDYIQNEWSGIPHFFRNFYVFQYSTGMIASMALVENAFEDKGGVERYIDLLKAGGSDYPLTILKKAGVDMMTPVPAQAAFKNIDNLITEMETIVARLKAQNRL
ncbi:MAG: oligoendopeptidase F [Candidatus Krumholzibacteria bacterium]|nr:oligoendopeptidase F [Candidatus Krumholzibacteria bacterium]